MKTSQNRDHKSFCNAIPKALLIEAALQRHVGKHGVPVQERVYSLDNRAMGCIERVETFSEQLGLSLDEYVEKAVMVLRTKKSKRNISVDAVAASTVFEAVRSGEQSALYAPNPAQGDIRQFYAVQRMPLQKEDKPIQLRVLEGIRSVISLLHSTAPYDISKTFSEAYTCIISNRLYVPRLSLIDHPYIYDAWKNNEYFIPGGSFLKALSELHQALPIYQTLLADTALYKWWRNVVCGGETILSRGTGSGGNNSARGSRSTASDSQ